MQFDITHRFTGSVIFEADIECAEGASRGLKLGLTVRAALKARANLREADLAYANLADANLAYANLRGANLAGANLAGAKNAPKLVGGGLRADGYRFQWIDGRIIAGCRDFSVEEARAHWGSADYRDAKLGAESMAIIDHMLRLVELRGWSSPAEREAA